MVIYFAIIVNHFRKILKTYLKLVRPCARVLVVYEKLIAYKLNKAYYKRTECQLETAVVPKTGLAINIFLMNLFS